MAHISKDHDRFPDVYGPKSFCQTCRAEKGEHNPHHTDNHPGSEGFERYCSDAGKNIVLQQCGVIARGESARRGAANAATRPPPPTAAAAAPHPPAAPAAAVGAHAAVPSASSSSVAPDISESIQLMQQAAGTTAFAAVTRPFSFWECGPALALSTAGTSYLPMRDTASFRPCFWSLDVLHADPCGDVSPSPCRSGSMPLLALPPPPLASTPPSPLMSPDTPPGLITDESFSSQSSPLAHLRSPTSSPQPMASSPPVSACGTPPLVSTPMPPPATASEYYSENVTTWADPRLVGFSQRPPPVVADARAAAAAECGTADDAADAQAPCAAVNGVAAAAADPPLCGILKNAGDATPSASTAADDEVAVPAGAHDVTACDLRFKRKAEARAEECVVRRLSHHEGVLREAGVPYQRVLPPPSPPADSDLDDDDEAADDARTDRRLRYLHRAEESARAKARACTPRVKKGRRTESFSGSAAAAARVLGLASFSSTFSSTHALSSLDAVPQPLLAWWHVGLLLSLAAVVVVAVFFALPRLFAVVVRSVPSAWTRAVRGIRAAHDIDRDAVALTWVWPLHTTRDVAERMVRRLAPPDSHHVIAYFRGHEDVVIDAAMFADHTQFFGTRLPLWCRVRHSATPNLRRMWWAPYGFPVYVAITRIRAGEELTLDWRQHYEAAGDAELFHGELRTDWPAAASRVRGAVPALTAVLLEHDDARAAAGRSRDMRLHRPRHPPAVGIPVARSSPPSPSPPPRPACVPMSPPTASNRRLRRSPRRLDVRFSPLAFAALLPVRAPVFVHASLTCPRPVRATVSRPRPAPAAKRLGSRATFAKGMCAPRASSVSRPRQACSPAAAAATSLVPSVQPRRWPCATGDCVECGVSAVAGRALWVYMTMSPFAAYAYNLCLHCLVCVCCCVLLHGRSGIVVFAYAAFLFGFGCVCLFLCVGALACALFWSVRRSCGCLGGPREDNDAIFDVVRHVFVFHASGAARPGAPTLCCSAR